MTINELPLWMPLLIAVLTTMAGMLVYSYNKGVDRKNALVELRRGIYRDYVLAIAEVSHSNNGAVAVNNYQRKLAELHLIASDEVVRACAEFTAVYRTKPDPGPDARATKYAALEMAMRRDCFEKTEITAAELRAMLPFTF